MPLHHEPSTPVSVKGLSGGDASSSPVSWDGGAMRPILSPSGFAAAYEEVRTFSETLVDPLEPEDMVIQTMPDVSPTKWHLAHTTWFFETFVLKHLPEYEAYDDRFEYLFNSYYNSIGEQFSRKDRGLLSRPTVAEINRYRSHVDGWMADLLADGSPTDELLRVTEIGLHHEQQHQELLLTDIKHVLGFNPMFPVYRERKDESTVRPSGTLRPEPSPVHYVRFEGGICEVGHGGSGHGGSGFAYDNETPRHEQLIRPFELAVRCVTNAEWQQFMADGGYDRPELWTSLGWASVKANDWQSPDYWFAREGRQKNFTLGGLMNVDPREPVTHISWFEADAYARWVAVETGDAVRLPTEFEWELACNAHLAAAADPNVGEFADSLRIHPTACGDAEAADPGPSDLRGLLGNGWEWTASPYLPYPGYRPEAGAIGEYNGKFMCQQFVLRGGSCATSRSHIRPTYRNFFPPDARWQFTSVRLCRDA